jgi:hypothetical protein
LQCPTVLAQRPIDVMGKRSDAGLQSGIETLRHRPDQYDEGDHGEHDYRNGSQGDQQDTGPPAQRRRLATDCRTTTPDRRWSLPGRCRRTLPAIVHAKPFP